MPPDRAPLIRVDPETGILRITLPDPVTSEVIEEALSSMAAIRGRSGLGLRLWDARGAEVRQSFAAVRATAGMAKEMSDPGAPPGKMAILVSDSTAFGVARQYLALLPQGYPLEIFTSEEDAKAWLLA